jgi:hypothetical protein
LVVVLEKSLLEQTLVVVVVVVVVVLEQSLLEHLKAAKGKHEIVTAVFLSKHNMKNYGERT